MNVLVIDVGGTHVKILATGQKDERRMDSGPGADRRSRWSRACSALAKGWKYDASSIGYPGAVVRNQPVTEPHNLGKGWVGFDYEAAFGCPVRIINDAAMQALGSYEGGKMLFLGFGTGLGTTLIVDGVHRADGARAPAVQEGDVRGLCRRARARARRQEEVAQARRTT